jgi:hypothetical protein
MKTPLVRAAMVAIVILPKMCVGWATKKDFFIDPRPAPRLQIGQLWDPSMLVDLTSLTSIPHIRAKRKADTSSLQLRAYRLEQTPVDFGPGVGRSAALAGAASAQSQIRCAARLA